MVFCVEHRIKFVIEFENPVDYFNVILQKQIDLRLKFDGNEKQIILFDFDFNNVRFNMTESILMFINNYSLIGQISYLQFNTTLNKHQRLKKIYKSMKKQKFGFIPEIFLSEDKTIISFDKYEHIMNTMLEELKLMCDNFEFSEDEKKIIKSIIEDPNLKSNVKFIGFDDYWILN